MSTPARERATIDYIKHRMRVLHPNRYGWIAIVFTAWGWRTSPGWRTSLINFDTLSEAVNYAASNYTVKYGKSFVYYRSRRHEITMD
jgi:hypothetical protein